METILNRIKNGQRLTGLRPIVLAVLTMGGLLLGAHPASGQSITGLCMEDRYKQATGGHLTCTANDVRIAHVTNIRDINGNPLSSCILGSTFTFQADFEVVLTAQARYDIGLYLATDGDPNGDGALTGSTTACQVGIITGGNSANYVNLDSSPDTCGDIDATHNPQNVHLVVTTKCVDSDNDGKLNLPNCTSWRQPGSNQVCDDPTDAYPGTTSKCNCDKNFNVDIFIERPNIQVVKDANPTQLDEPGGSVTFTVTVTNPAVATSVTLTTIVDDPDNDPNTINSVTYQASSICDKTLLQAGGDSTTCTFIRTILGNAGQSFTDRACVIGVDSNNNPVGPSCDTASVSLRDVVPTAVVTKTVLGGICAVVSYGVKVENTDTVESLTLFQLVDDKFGDITAVQGNVVATTCSVPQTIATSGKYECTFDANVCSSPHTDKVTATLSDNDGNTITPSGQATVTITIE